MLTAAEASRPAGDIYVLTDEDVSKQAATAYRIRKASPDLLRAAFGKGKEDPISPLLQEIVDGGALFLSTAGPPFECMVFHCISHSDTGAVAKLLLERKETLRQQYKGSDEQAIIEKGQIVIIGKYVLFATGGAFDTMIEAAYRSISK